MRRTAKIRARIRKCAVDYFVLHCVSAGGNTVSALLHRVPYRQPDRLCRNAAYNAARQHLSDFADFAKVTWSKPYIRWAVAEGLLSGKAQSGKLYLDPQGNATRAEVAAIMRSIITNIIESDTAVFASYKNRKLTISGFDGDGTVEWNPYSDKTVIPFNCCGEEITVDIP